ncbi:phage head completion protein [Methylobacillus pratensis]
MGAGALRERIRIKKREGQPTMGGGVHEHYCLVAEVWAEMVPVGNALFFGAIQIAESVTHSFKVRMDASIGLTRHGIGGDHVIECRDGDAWYRYRVKRSDELKSERHHLLIQTELLKELCDG